MLNKSKAALASEENFFSLFVIDAINCNLRILYFNNEIHNKYLKKYFLSISQNEDSFIINNKIKKILNMNFKYDNNFKQIIYAQQKRIIKFTQNIE